MQEFNLKIGEDKSKKNIIVKNIDFTEQADAGIFVQVGDTLMMTTVVCAKKITETEKDFLPLTVEYEERFYAGGEIKGVRYTRREGKASDQAILNGRMVDRAIRPCFSKDFIQEIQVINTCLSWDEENSPDIPALIGASLAVMKAKVPFQGPIGAVRVVYNQHKFIINPTYKEREGAELDIILTGVVDIKTKELLINMIDGQAIQVQENIVIQAIEYARPYLQANIRWQEDIMTKIGIKDKIEITYNKQQSEPEIKKMEKKLQTFIGNQLVKALFTQGKQKKLDKIEELQQLAFVHLQENSLKNNIEEKTIKMVVENFFQQEKDRILREFILKEDKRPDGRSVDEIREIKCQLDLLPRAHGSALFTRGETRSLSILTLGAPGDKQLLDGMEIVNEKHFIHHYNFPPYSTGEIRPMTGPKRRDIGHGMLAEKALMPAIPCREVFPYTIRIVSEILSSNGSTSMAAVSSSSLALMAAGVPIKTHVAGIALGLIMDKQNKNNYKILTDIQGPEDHFGDMDFKVAGTINGITAIQLDVKIEGINLEIIKHSLLQGRKAREQILSKMNEVIKFPRKQVSIYAPKISCFDINPIKIKDIIGPRGAMINKIIEKYGVEIDVNQQGRVCILSDNEDSLKKAINIIKNLTAEAELGKIYQGKVVRTVDFGAFVEIFPGQDGMIHISKLSPKRIKRVEDVVKVGDQVEVLVEKIDEQGRVGLLLKRVLS
jgi:polyribonucleotide nucleotidyltransferase